ncbi:MAG TPA: hypothetical protein VFA61_04005 [Candidatus Udaeobacter sp.]|jgi:hypothetical protein|nr:hypothetical protein [Candidatus Udaeobacter sp.]
MKTFLAAATIGMSLLSISLLAKTWELQFDNEKVSSIVFPDSWETDQRGEFIDSWSPGRQAHVVVSVFPMRLQKSGNKSRDRIAPEGTNIDEVFRELDTDKERDALLESAVNYFKDDEVSVETNSKKVQNFTGKGEIEKIKRVTLDGQRKGQLVTAIAGIISLRTQKKYIEFHYWFPKAQESELQPQIGGIIHSITPREAKRDHRPNSDELPENPYDEGNKDR